MIPLVVFVGGDLCIPLANELGVHTQAIYIHVGQKAAVFVTSTFVEFQTDGFTSHQTTIGFKGLLSAILG
jgi:hypothetical protein